MNEPPKRGRILTKKTNVVLPVDLLARADSYVAALPKSKQSRSRLVRRALHEFLERNGFPA
jgi:metal-responsive CopG/Arc/MetJ family transcriptional regulator